MARGAPGVAAVVLLLLSGCSDAPVADPREGLVEAAPGIWLAPGMGALVFHVITDAGLPLAQARISILGTEHFGRTDARGMATFVNVTAGVAQMQVSMANFQTWTLDGAVPDQAVAHVNVTMLPDSSVGAGYLPHEHDLWRGSDKYAMLDQQRDLTTGSGTLPAPYYAVIQGFYSGINNASRWDLPLAEAPEGNRPIVLPGTKSMEVRLDWDDPTLDVLGLCYVAPGSQFRCLGAQAAPAVWTIDVAPSEADGGHARWSLWRLSMYHPPWTQTMQPSTTTATVHATIELTRGNLAVDPPHPDFWTEGNEIVVHDDEWTDTSQCCGAHPGVRPESVIPPGTTQLRVEHEWTFRGAGAGPTDFDFQLLLRTGGMNPHTTPVRDYLHPAPVEGGAAQQRKVYELDVSAEDTDAYYQTSSTWYVVFWDQFTGKEDYHAQYRDTVHHLRIVAYR